MDARIFIQINPPIPLGVEGLRNLVFGNIVRFYPVFDPDEVRYSMVLAHGGGPILAAGVEHILWIFWPEHSLEALKAKLDATPTAVLMGPPRDVHASGSWALDRMTRSEWVAHYGISNDATISTLSPAPAPPERLPLRKLVIKDRP